MSCEHVTCGPEAPEAALLWPRDVKGGREAGHCVGRAWAWRHAAFLGGSPSVPPSHSRAAAAAAAQPATSISRGTQRSPGTVLVVIAWGAWARLRYLSQCIGESPAPQANNYGNQELSLWGWPLPHVSPIWIAPGQGPGGRVKRPWGLFHRGEKGPFIDISLLLAQTPKAYLT